MADNGILNRWTISHDAYGYVMSGYITIRAATLSEAMVLFEQAFPGYMATSIEKA